MNLKGLPKRVKLYPLTMAYIAVVVTVILVLLILRGGAL
jgi:hypothetical protein